MMLDNMRFAVDQIRTENPSLPECYINYINNVDINAGAIAFKGKYYIGLIHASVNILTALFAKILASPKLLSSFGKVNKEI